MFAKSDTELLREYAEHAAESAFTEIVNRHTNLVYSAALRLMNSPETAAEVAQTVFVGLARRARSLVPMLRQDASLAGWLCRSARNVSLNLRRNEFRRRSRERQAMEQLDPLLETRPDWERLRPVLDEVMGELSEPDYDAVVMRFFQNQDLLSVGRALGVSHDAAQKRVSRALDKLRDLLSQRGITTASTALSMLLSAKAVEAAPAGLGAAISSAPAFLSETGFATTATAAAKAIAMTTLQKTLLTLSITIVAAGVAVPLVIQHRHQVEVREENPALRLQAEQLGQFAAENARLSNLVVRSSQVRTLPDAPSSELLRLRGEVGMLREQNQELAKRLVEQQQPTASFEPSSAWADAGNATPEAAVGTFAWAVKVGNKEKLAQVVAFEPEPANANLAALVEQTSKAFQVLLSGIEASRLVFKDNPAPDEVTLWYQDRFPDGHTTVAPLTVKRIGGQWRVKFIFGTGETAN